MGNNRVKCTINVMDGVRRGREGFGHATQRHLKGKATRQTRTFDRDEADLILLNANPWVEVTKPVRWT